jgi:hypothetical protein
MRHFMIVAAVATLVASAPARAQQADVHCTTPAASGQMISIWTTTDDCQKRIEQAQAASSDPAIQDWESLPENSSMREVCSTTLRYSTAIANLQNQGAGLPALLRWAEQEAERSAADLPTEPLLPIGTMLILTKLIQASYLDALVYQQIRGGFPQFAYRSCLKGRPIDQ